MSTDIFTVPREWVGYAAFVIGGGPSIRDFDFSRLRGKGKVIAVNDAGIEPDRAPWADVLFWADRRWLEWNADKLANHTGQYKITRKRPHIETGHDIKFLRFLPFAHHGLSNQGDALGGWCGGSSAINLAYLFGARVIILLGFDMTPGNWHNNHKMPPLPDQHRSKFIPTLEKMEPELTRHKITVINTNPRSALRCFPFASIEEILAMDDVALIEREKYLAVWNRQEYRNVSPGMLETERAAMVCDMRAGMSLIDFGSGPCRATAWFKNVQGMNVVGVDFAPNARETDVPFVEACLWELPDTLLPADFGFCCDVMEHIPEQKIDAVLQGIASRSKIGCYFRIATRPDKMGPRLINKPLHMTVKEGEFWRRKVENHFPIVDVIENSTRDIMLWARH